MTFLAPLAAWLGLGAVIVLAVHVLRPVRSEAVVSSTLLWERIERTVSSARPWQRLVLSLLLLAQLLVTALLVAAALRPALDREGELAAHTVFVIDASGSMAASDGRPDRLGDAVERARDLRRDLPDEGTASLVVAGIDPEVALTRSPDVGAFDRAVGSVRTTPGRADLAGAAAEAAALAADGASSVVLISDGGLELGEVQQFPPGTRWERVGADSANRSVSRLAVEPRDGGLIARVNAIHRGGPDVVQTLRIDVDGRTHHSEEVELSAGDLVSVDAVVPFGERIEAFLDGDDLVDADDRARAALPPRRELDVLWVGPPNLFIQSVLSALGDLAVERVDAVPTDLSGHDLVVFDRVDPPADLDRPALLIAPPSGIGGIVPSGVAEWPALTLVRSSHPFLAGLDLSELGVVSSQVVDPGRATVLLGAPGVPLLLVDEERSLTYLTFALDESNLPLLGEFPVLVDRLVDGLVRRTEPTATLVVGETLPVPTNLESTVVLPDGRSEVVPAGALAPRAESPGFHRVRFEDDVRGAVEVLVAVDPDPRESDVTVPDSLDLPVPEAGSEIEPARILESLVPWIAAAALVALAAEWWIHRRRVGVSRRQWGVARSLRVVIAALLVAVLAAPVVERPTDEVAVVVVADYSDSLGPAGRTATTAWIDEAMAARRGGDLLGVVAVGADARVSQPVSRDPIGGPPIVRLDRSETDLAAGLRLAQASLPTEAGRRLVLVSDGRPTRGDVDAELDRLAELDVPVDVVSVGGELGDDVAVASLSLPPLARVGDRVTLEAELNAGASTAARLVLRRDGTVVEERDVTLDAGRTRVTFVDDDVDAPGVSRYQLEVAGVGDSVPANDIAVAALPVEGPARVLVLEGAAGDGAEIAAGLEAGGIATSVRPARQMPPLEELSGWSAVVLADVDRLDLTSSQVDDLDAAVRDLGRGLVVIGGTRSFGLGRYLGSDLEELLPVVSEVEDDERRLDIAQVLAIDTSASMGACHCQEGQVGGNGFGADGGVNKTDIARVAAERAIETLNETDEVGVLAVGDSARWALDLQRVPDGSTVSEALGTLEPDGDTRIRGILEESAAALAESDAALRHVVLFTDGFTGGNVLSTLADDAADLRADGITVSVIGTGEGAAEELRAIAEAGGGRFYAGRDLEQIPEILVEETEIASRDMVVEGEFFPTVVSSSDVVEGLDVAPILRGFQALTAKPTARVHLTVGPEDDPLLTSWRTGLGKVSAWTSDGGRRWAEAWTDWDGAAAHWSRLVRDVLPSGDDAGTVSAVVDGADIEVRVDSEDGAWPDGAQATARLVSPEGERLELPLERTGGGTFVGRTRAGGAGVYSVGAEVAAAGESVFTGRSFATRGYGAEYEPDEVDVDAMEQWSSVTGGRGFVEAVDVFSRDGLVPGTRALDLIPPLLLVAALLWPLAVVLGLVPFGRAARRPGGSAGETGRADERSRPPGRALSSGRRRGLGDNGQPPSGGAEDPAAGGLGGASGAGTARTKRAASSTIPLNPQGHGPVPGPDGVGSHHPGGVGPDGDGSPPAEIDDGLGDDALGELLRRRRHRRSDS